MIWGLWTIKRTIRFEIFFHLGLGGTCFVRRLNFGQLQPAIQTVGICKQATALEGSYLLLSVVVSVAPLRLPFKQRKVPSFSKPKIKRKNFFFKRLIPQLID